MRPTQQLRLWLACALALAFPDRLSRRREYQAVALPQSFQILDSQDQLSMIKRLLKAANVDDEKYPAKTLMYFINNAKDQGMRAHQVNMNQVM